MLAVWSELEWKDACGLSLKFKTLSQLGAGFAVDSVLLKYSRWAESQADLMGTQILYDSKLDTRGMAQFFEVIQAENQGGRQVEFFSNHPNPDNRVANVNKEVSLFRWLAERIQIGLQRVPGHQTVCSVSPATPGERHYAKFDR